MKPLTLDRRETREKREKKDRQLSRFVTRLFNCFKAVLA